MVTAEWVLQCTVGLLSRSFFFPCRHIGKKIPTCRHIIRLENTNKYRQLLRSTIVPVSLPCLLLGEVIKMTDSMIFIAQRKSRDINPEVQRTLRP